MGAPDGEVAGKIQAARPGASHWGFILELFGGPWRALAAFALAYVAMSALGYHYKPDLAVPAVLWPAAGVLFSALWICERRLWPVVLLVQVVADLAVTAYFIQPFSAATALPYAASNCLGGVIGAALARRYVSERIEFRTARSLQMLVATAVGSVAGALPGVWANDRHFDNPMGFLTQLEIWSAGNWLGIVAVVPVLNSWFSPLRRERRELQLRSRVELVALMALLAVATIHVFGMSSRPATILQVPFTLAAIMLYAAYRLPPRWAATLAMLVAFASVELVNRGGGPYTMADAFTRNALLQGVLATLVVMSFLMSLALVEIRVSVSDRADSESRYRSLVELSTDAIWRVELDPPMPVSLPLEEQVAWLRRHARIAECNKAYLQVDPGAIDPTNGHWQFRIPWSGVYEAHLAQIIHSGYAIDGLRFRATMDGRQHSYLTAFSGVLQDGRLHRIWGVASDITELVELNMRLQRDQDRLRTYARQIVVAEEQARRATAVDLHDGIGQSLTGMAMTLNVAREQASPEVRLLIDEVRARLREVQDRTRHMISDLSPPGLYELGLGPALQWLAVYMRRHDGLEVALDLDFREDSVRLGTRVLVFKLVRELLRNVVKHAGVSAATVSVRSGTGELTVEVADKGRGFDAQIDMFGAVGSDGRGFGLWSIADRVQEVGGRFTVDAAPGQGARFVLHFPLLQMQDTGSQPVLQSARPGSTPWSA